VTDAFEAQDRVLLALFAQYGLIDGHVAAALRAEHIRALESALAHLANPHNSVEFTFRQLTARVAQLKAEATR
jgi:hypothetical protein